MESRRPSDLEVIDVLSRRVEAQLEGNPLQRCCCLKDSDRVVEIGDVNGLGRTVFRSYKVEWTLQVEALLGGKRLGGRGTHCPIEVAVQLRLTPNLVLAYESE
jgi:hypothetical protein